mgnify:CR=1 FL=1
MQIVVGLGPVDTHVVQPVLGDNVKFVANPSDTDIAEAVGAIVRAAFKFDAAQFAKMPNLKVIARTGVGTVIAEGKEHKDFDGKTYILERAINADLPIVKAWKADPSGNLVFRKTARNFNVPAATCGKVCVVEVEELVEPGQLDADAIHLPGVYVQRLIVGSPYDKKIEFRTTRSTDVG